MESKYRVDTKNQTIIGHSLGGNFAIYALLKHPSMFDRYVIGSPGLHWDKNSLLDLEEANAGKHAYANKRIFISVGDKEDDFDLDNSIKQITNTRELYNRLRSSKYKSLQVDFKLFEDKNHITAIPETITQGLQSVFVNR